MKVEEECYREGWSRLKPIIKNLLLLVWLDEQDMYNLVKFRFVNIMSLGVGRCFAKSLSNREYREFKSNIIVPPLNNNLIALHS